MTRGEFDRPSSPGMANTAVKRDGRVGCCRALLVCGVFVFALATQASAGRGNELPEGTISEIRFSGNVSITEGELKTRIKSRVGRPLDRVTIDADTRSLSATKWFSQVDAVYEPSTDKKGYVLIFQVEEMPKLRDVQFIGLKNIKRKDVEEATGLKVGAHADSSRAIMAVEQIRVLYEEKGYEKAEVRLLEGNRPGQTRVVFEIAEGPKFKVDSVTFVGNNFVEDGVLNTKIESRRAYFKLVGGRRSKDGLEADKRSLVKYYQDNGYFDVKISATTRPGKSLGEEQITFTISEGVQYKVNAVIIEGNKKIPAAELKQGLLLKVGDPYNEAIRDIDFKAINTHYWRIGCIDTKIEREQPIDEKPGLINVKYVIEEGEPYILGRLIIRGNGRTKDKVVRREALMAGLLPGEVLDMNRLDTFRKRLNGTGLFGGGGGPQGPAAKTKPIEIQIVNKRPGNKPFGDEVFSKILTSGDDEKPRMQSPDPELQLPGDPPALPPIEIPPMLGPSPSPVPDQVPGPAQTSPPISGGPSELKPFGGELFAPDANTVPSIPALTPGPPPSGGFVPGARPRPGGLPVRPGSSSGDGFPNLPNNNMNNVGPDLNEGFPNRSYADIVTNVDEAPTGRLMFGLGASSFGGLNGNIIFHESNFDIFNVPRSFSDITNRRAFRGAGQELRVDLMPGTLINRYTVSFRDPYLFELPLGLGVSGYQTSRYYPDFRERRSGGRVSLGYQFGTQTYADIAARVEDVNLQGFKYPAPADLLAAAGHTTLATIRPAIRFDNRNNPVAPTSGSYLEAAFEEGFGTFNFSKFTLEGKQHFTTGARPDNSGKRTLTFRGRFGVTTRDTPIYERFFEGDFRSMRGFSYRGVGPHVLGVNTGGILETVGSVEYQFPWTASDTLQQVVFCDFGTAEADYRYTNFRAAVGTGLRVVIPQITGQLPMAFDLSFPISKADGDKTKYFTFFIGAFW